MFLSLGGSGSGDSKSAVSSYSVVEAILKFAVPRFWICCLSGNAGRESFVFLLLSKSHWWKFLEAASSGNFPAH